MHLSAVFINLAFLATVTEAFQSRAPQSATRLSKKLFASSTETEEQTVQDLDLEQMFEVFEEADKAVKGPSAYTGKFDPQSQPGISSPLGFFDPARISLDATEREFTVFQEAEVKHGRVAMLAFLGLAVAEVFHPLFGGQIDGPAINHFQQCQAQMPLFPVWASWAIAMVEGHTIMTAWQPPKETFSGALGIAKMKEGHIAGDIGFDPLNLKPKDADAFATMRTKELNNGRLAMIGVAGFVAQELVTGSTIF